MAKTLGLTFGGRFPWIRTAGELPARADIPKLIPDAGLSDRAVASDPLGDWYLALPDKLQPKQISTILRGALAGNIWQQTQLTQRMLDSWPMFKKCVFELRAAVSSVKYVVHAYTEPDEKPSETAKDKAHLVRRALENFRPDRFQDEDSAHGMIFDLTDAVINGVSIVELIWNEDAEDPDGNPESNVRASAWVHPRHYGFNSDGGIGVVKSRRYSPLEFGAQTNLPLLDDPAKFLVAKFKSKSGSCLGAGFMRPLAYYWAMVMYGRDFMLQFAQKYGNPFMAIAYQSGITKQEVDDFEAAAQRAANQGFLVYPYSGDKPTEVKIVDAQKMGRDNAQVVMIEMANEACQMLMLGQTLTSAAPQRGGSRAQGDVHENVRQERLEEIAKWVGRILTEQFAESLLQVNYAESSERPTVEPDLTRPLDALEKADFLTSLSTATVPVPLEAAYKTLGWPVPSPGDAVITAGKIGLLGDTEKEIDPNPAPQSPMVKLGPDGKPLQMPLDHVASNPMNAITKAVEKATPEQFRDLRELVLKARSAHHFNGEWEAVMSKVDEINSAEVTAPALQKRRV